MFHDVTLTRNSVTLRPERIDDSFRLHSLIDPAMWAGMAAPFPTTIEEFQQLQRSTFDADDVMNFAVEYHSDVVGRTSFYGIIPGLRTDVGSTFYARDMQGTHVNATAKLLLMDYAFNTLNVERVALRCDSRNTRSHHAILKLGATFEGRMRRFRPASDGTIADVDYFSVIREEWPQVQQQLEQRVDTLMSRTHNE